MNTTRFLGAIVTVSLLSLAGCTSESQDTVTQTTSTQTITSAMETVDPTTPSAQPGGEPPSTVIPGWDELPPDPVGKEISIAGEPATVCIYGDGWGTNIWAGNATTSCEFVSAVHEELIRGLNATTDNIRLYLKPQISVSSPVTGQIYDMNCDPRGDELVACSGGNNATVYFY